MKQWPNPDMVFAPTNNHEKGTHAQLRASCYLEQHLLDTCRTRLENVLLMVVGMFQAGSVHLAIPCFYGV